mmetsp:Transcript_32095/g.73368  ORF Transcript_32095/g.73368 Transcript_32095/m.73368 type:complete len:569 (-) Transcript_32095:62-1768(-)
MSMAMVRAKVDAESRQNEERKAVEKRRNLIVLCASFFRDLGYAETVRQIQTDTSVSLEKVEVADNIDLASIVTEYEDFYEMRFGRKPKLTRKALGGGSSADRKAVSLPRLPQDVETKVLGGSTPEEGAGPAGRDSRRERGQSRKRGEATSPTASKRQGGAGADEASTKPSKADAPKKAGAPSEPAAADAGAGFDGGLVGQSVTKVSASSKRDAAKGEDPAAGVPGEDYYSNRIKPALPAGMGFDHEYRELAMAISRDILNRNPGVSWDSIVGLGPAKSLLKEAVVMPLKYPELFTGLLSPWKGVLLFGPPGTGKTLLAKAVATECETTFFNISASTVVSKWRGDSEKLIRVLFDMARHHQPSTIFIDELDSLMSARGGGDSEHEGSRRMKTELLIQMDGLLRDTRDQVFLLAASNLPWDLDSAMLRRLEKRILVALPTAEARESMLQTYLPPQLSEALDYKRLAGHTEDWSGSDLRLLCKEAAMHPLRRLMAEIESAESKEAEAAQRTNSRQRAAEKATAPSRGRHIENLKMSPVNAEDVARALQTVHRAPAAHTARYAEWQEQFGAA